jgi:hypothetical protein
MRAWSSPIYNLERSALLAPMANNRSGWSGEYGSGCGLRAHPRPRKNADFRRMRFDVDLASP